MLRRWKEPVRDFKGEGKLHDSKGHTSKVSYHFTIWQNCWEQLSINAPPGVGRGSLEAPGELIPLEPIVGIDINSPSFILELNLGQKVKVIPLKFSGPFSPIPVRISELGALLEDGEP